MQTINLDLSVKSIIPVLHAKQADVGRKFKAILSDGGAAYPLPAGAAVSIWYSGASGEGNYTDVGANSAVSVSGNEIVVEMIAQMLANYGVGTVCIVIHTADGKQLGTWNIPYMVEPLPGMGSAAAQAYFTSFSKAVEGLAYPDASLSVPGKSADAAAVGAALAEKAPASKLVGFASAVFAGSGTPLDAIKARWGIFNEDGITAAHFYVDGGVWEAIISKYGANLGSAIVFGYGATRPTYYTLIGGVWTEQGSL